MTLTEWRARLDRGGINGEDAFAMWKDWLDADTKTQNILAYVYDCLGPAADEIMEEAKERS